MRIGVQNFGQGTFVKSLRARKHRRGGAKKVIVAALTLTSMVDMFSLLVIFLLKNFSASPEMIYVNKGVVLPDAAVTQELLDAPVLSIALDGVYLDQKFVATVADLLENPLALIKGLRDQRELWLKTHPGQPFPGKVTLQAHKELDGTVISQVMGLLPSSHYSSIQLAVVTGGGS